MARRLVSTMVDDEAGNRLGGTGTELRVYTDEAMTILATLYQRASGAGTQTQPRTPNAGRFTTLTAQGNPADVTITVADVTGFAVGDLIPVYDGTNTVYRIITNINAGTKVLTLDLSLGFTFTVAATSVNNADMTGHVFFWLEDTQDYYGQTKDVASGRLMPQLQFPIRAAIQVFQAMEEAALLGNTRNTINIIGSEATITDDVPNSRFNLEIRSWAKMAGVI